MASDLKITEYTALGVTNLTRTDTSKTTLVYDATTDAFYKGTVIGLLPDVTTNGQVLTVDGPHAVWREATTFGGGTVMNDATFMRGITVRGILSAYDNIALANSKGIVGGSANTINLANSGQLNLSGDNGSIYVGDPNQPGHLKVVKSGTGMVIDMDAVVTAKSIATTFASIQSGDATFQTAVIRNGVIDDAYIKGGRGTFTALGATTATLNNTDIKAGNATFQTAHILNGNATFATVNIKGGDAVLNTVTATTGNVTNLNIAGGTTAHGVTTIDAVQIASGSATLNNTDIKAGNATFQTVRILGGDATFRNIEANFVTAKNASIVDGNATFNTAVIGKAGLAYNCLDVRNTATLSDTTVSKATIRSGDATFQTANINDGDATFYSLRVHSVSASNVSADYVAIKSGLVTFNAASINSGAATFTTANIKAGDATFQTVNIKGGDATFGVVRASDVSASNVVADRATITVGYATFDTANIKAGDATFQTVSVRELTTDSVTANALKSSRVNATERLELARFPVLNGVEQAPEAKRFMIDRTFGITTDLPFASSSSATFAGSLVSNTINTGVLYAYGAAFEAGIDVTGPAMFRGPVTFMGNADFTGLAAQHWQEGNTPIIGLKTTDVGNAHTIQVSSTFHVRDAIVTKGLYASYADTSKLTVGGDTRLARGATFEGNAVFTGANGITASFADFRGKVTAGEISSQTIRCNELEPSVLNGNLASVNMLTVNHDAVFEKAVATGWLAITFSPGTYGGFCVGSEVAGTPPVINAGIPFAARDGIETNSFSASYANIDQAEITSFTATQMSASEARFNILNVNGMANVEMGTYASLLVKDKLVVAGKGCPAVFDNVPMVYNKLPNYEPPVVQGGNESEILTTEDHAVAAANVYAHKTDELETARLVCGTFSTRDGGYFLQGKIELPKRVSSATNRTTQVRRVQFHSANYTNGNEIAIYSPGHCGLLLAYNGTNWNIYWSSDGVTKTKQFLSTFSHGEHDTPISVALGYTGATREGSTLRPAFNASIDVNNPAFNSIQYNRTMIGVTTVDQQQYEKSFTAWNVSSNFGTTIDELDTVVFNRVAGDRKYDYTQRTMFNNLNVMGKYIDTITLP